MKKAFAIAAIACLFACTKTNVQAPAATAALSPETNLSAPQKSRTALLTAHPWMYQGYYFHYTDQQHKGDPEYVRGSSTNILDLDDTRFNFRKNGTFLEISGGYRYPGTWQFTNAADTVLVMAYSYGTNVNTIVTLTSNQLYYTKPIGSYSHNNFAYTELITAQ